MEKVPKIIYVSCDDEDNPYWYDTAETLAEENDDGVDINIGVYELKKKVVASWDRALKIKDAK